MVPGSWITAMACLLASSVNGQEMYSKNSPVVQVNARNYHKLISKTSQVSSLKPKYEKAARGLRDLAQVAAINCDEEDNKPVCASQSVKGFPTLKIVRPGKKANAPFLEDYQGPREAQAIIDAVKAAIPNKVKRVGDKGIDAWLNADNSTVKAILFSDKAVTGAFIRVIANEFIGTMHVAQVRNTEKTTVAQFGITKYPTLLVLPGGTQEAVQYEGAFTKKDLMAFLTRYASPSDGRSVKDKVKDKVKSAVGKDVPKAKPAEKEAFSKSSASHQSSQASSAAASATGETIVDDGRPVESPNPIVPPRPAESPEFVKLAPRISFLRTQADLEKNCLGEKSPICILTLLPSDYEEPVAGEIFDLRGSETSKTLDNLANLVQNHKARESAMFPVYAIPHTVAGSFRGALGLQEELTLVAVNARRGYYRHFVSVDFEMSSIETWVDNMRLGEGAKKPLPESVIIRGETATEEPAPEAAPEKSSADHDEL